MIPKRSKGIPCFSLALRPLLHFLSSGDFPKAAVSNSGQGTTPKHYSNEGTRASDKHCLHCGSLLCRSTLLLSKVTSCKLWCRHSVLSSSSATSQGATCNETSLCELRDALGRFHKHWKIFETVGVCCNGFSLPHKHSISHYYQLICMFGAPNGLCLSITKSKHIKAIKEPWRPV
jgi:hypothetical protein